MLNSNELEAIWKRAKLVNVHYPVTHESLVGVERLAVLHVLTEPLQSTLHSILQRNVAQDTACVFKGCKGHLNKEGGCSEKCEQSGVNAVQDIIDCLNCDSYGFPCPTCHDVIFNGQLKMYLG